MKEYQVISKYKNPDKYIQQLKSTINWKDENTRTLLNENSELRKKNQELKEDAYGVYWGSYGNAKEENNHQAWTCSESSVRNVKLGDEVWVKGKITKVEFTDPEVGKSGLTYSYDEIYIKKTGKDGK